MKKLLISALIFATAASFSFAATPDSLKKDLEDYDYLVSFVEQNYAPFDAIMQKGYKREYKALKKQLRKKLSKGDASLERTATDYILWFYSQFDQHISLVNSELFPMAQLEMVRKSLAKGDTTLLTDTEENEYNPRPVSCKVDSLTRLIRVPSCNPDFYDGTVNALEQFLASDCVNLIIDVRGNGGGGDNVWKGYYDLLYDHPYMPESKWHRNTPKNLLYWKEMLKLQPKSPWNLQLIERCEASKKKFVKLNESDSGDNRQPTSRIKRAAVLIDCFTASAAESLAEFVKKESDRAKVYGIWNTSGCDLTGNCRTEPLPNSRFGVYYATTVDSGFYEKDFSSEGLGISPDVLIPLPFARKLTDNIDEWVLWVAEDLKK